QRSNEFPLLAKGNKQKSADAASDTQTWKIVLCGAGVGNMERAVLAHPTNLWRINADLDAADGWDWTKMSPGNNSVSFPESQYRVIYSTNPRSTLDDRIEHRLHVGW